MKQYKMSNILRKYLRNQKKSWASYPAQLRTGQNLTTIADPWYFWKGICHSKAHKPVTLSRNPTFTKV